MQRESQNNNSFSNNRYKNADFKFSNKNIILGKSTAQLCNMDIKQQVIDYLYNKVDLTKYRYIMLNNISKLKFLQENEHYVSPNFKGYNYLLIMMTINNIRYCFLLDRKKLSYHKNQIDMKALQILSIKMNASEAMFCGSIIDGKLIQSNNNYHFLIQDCFYLMGNKLLEMEIYQKLQHIDSVLKNNFSKELNDKYCNNFDFKINKLYNYTELIELINTTLPQIKQLVNGIIFYPKFSGVNILHLDKKVEKNITLTDNITVENKSSDIIEQKSYSMINDFVNFLKNRTYSYEKNGKMNVLWLSRTEIPDVYNINENLDTEKLGIALIPNLKISHLCNDYIKDEPVKFNCIFSNQFKKWIPLSVKN